MILINSTFSRGEKFIPTFEEIGGFILKQPYYNELYLWDENHNFIINYSPANLLPMVLEPETCEHLRKLIYTDTANTLGGEIVKVFTKEETRALNFSFETR